MTERPLKNRAEFFDVQEPTTEDLNFINLANIDQLTVRQKDLIGDGIVPGTNTFNTVVSIVGSDLSVNIGYGVAYIDGNRIEISSENSYSYLVESASWGRVDADSVPIPRSTGNIGIIVPQPSPGNAVGIFISYLSEVPFDPVTGEPTDFCIDYLTYKRNYTRRVDGYVINWSTYAIGSVVEPSSPSGARWLHLAEITMSGGSPVINYSVRKFSKINAGLEPEPEVALHQFTHHSDGIANSKKIWLTPIIYPVQETRIGSLATVDIHLSPHTRVIDLGQSYSVLGVKVPIYNSSSPISISNLSLTINNSATSITYPSVSIPSGYSYVVFNLSAPINTDIVTIVLRSAVSSLLAIESSSVQSAPAYNIYAYGSVTGWNNVFINSQVDRLNDELYLLLPDPNINPLVVSGTRITQYSYLGSPVSPGTVNLPIYSSQIPEPVSAGPITYYVLLDNTGEISVESSPSPEKLTLARFTGKAEKNWTTQGGLIFQVDDMRISDVNGNNITELRRNLNIFPSYGYDGSTSSFMQWNFGYTADVYNVPKNPITLFITQQWGKTRLQFKSSDGTVLAQISQTTPYVYIPNLAAEVSTVTSESITNATITGSLSYPVSHGEDYLMLSDASGNAYWAHPTAKKYMRAGAPISTGYIPVAVGGGNLAFGQSPIYVEYGTGFIGISTIYPRAKLDVQTGNVLLSQGYGVVFDYGENSRIGYESGAFLTPKYVVAGLDVIIPGDSNKGLRIGSEGVNPAYEIAGNAGNYLHYINGPVENALNGSFSDAFQVVANLNSPTLYPNLRLVTVDSLNTLSGKGFGSGIRFDIKYGETVINAASIFGSYSGWRVPASEEAVLHLGVSYEPNLCVLTNRNGYGTTSGVEIGMHGYSRSTTQRLGRLHVWQPFANEYNIVAECGNTSSKALIAQYNTTDTFVVYGNGEVEFPTASGTSPSLPVGSGTAIVLGSDNRLKRSSSSIRYKTNVQELSFNSELIYQLRPVSFNFKSNPDAPLTFGLIAEDVVKYIPELVHLNSSGEPESVDYSRISVLLLSEIKKLKQRIEALESA